MRNSLVKHKQSLSTALRDSIPKGLEWVCADTSASMLCMIADSPLTRIQALNQAIHEIDERVQWLGFDRTIHHNKNHDPFYASGGTDFCVAIKELILYEPSYVIFISDGEDESGGRVLDLVEQLAITAIIDTLYIGEDNPTAETLMKSIARIGHGRFQRWDSTKKQTLSLTSVIKGLLPAPAQPEAIKL